MENRKEASIRRANKTVQQDMKERQKIMQDPVVLSLNRDSTLSTTDAS